MLRSTLLGLLGGVLVGAGLAWHKQRVLAARAAVAQQAFSARGSGLEALLLLEGGRLQADLRRDAEVYAPNVVRNAADDVLARHFWLTPAQLDQLGAFVARFGGSS